MSTRPSVEVRLYERPGPGAEPVAFVAGVSFGGRPVSLDCNHLHHTEAAAEHCVQMVEEREAQWARLRPERIGANCWEQTRIEIIVEHLIGTLVVPERERIRARRFTFLGGVLPEGEAMFGRTGWDDGPKRITDLRTCAEVRRL